MAELTQTITVKLVCGPLEVEAMTEPEFKQYLLRILREAINAEDAVIIQPRSNQALVLQDVDADQG